MRSRFIQSVAVLFLGTGLVLAVRAAELTVFAAASLSDALQEIARHYAPAGGDTLRFNFAASSTLARQIKEGAPADLFFSADEAKMDDLAQAGLIAPGTRRSLLSNTLVVIVPTGEKSAIRTPDDLASPTLRRLALAETQTVPAGIYAREWLVKTGLWEKLSGRIVPTENVRACLAAVASGNVDAGIVYKTDALITNKVRIVLEVPAAGGPKISYPFAVVQGTRSPDAARRFAAYLASPAARAVFVHCGFLPAP